jgi:signal-transduction protein with cAMP-binding, CBS, and nucleotidyltransferase domain
MLLRMRRPRAATTLGGRWAEGCLTIRADETVAQAVRLMAAHEVGCLVVMDDRAGDEVAGVITERTYSRKIILQGRDSDTTRVGDVMKTQVVCVHAEEKLDVVAEVLSQRRIRHLPVVGGPEMAGAPGPDHVLGCARARVCAHVVCAHASQQQQQQQQQ